MFVFALLILYVLIESCLEVQLRTDIAVKSFLGLSSVLKINSSLLILTNRHGPLVTTLTGFHCL